MKNVRLATLTRILGSTDHVPLTVMQKKFLRKRKRNIKTNVYPKTTTV